LGGHRDERPARRQHRVHHGLIHRMLSHVAPSNLVA
jgi:hypothetical protein